MIEGRTVWYYCTAGALVSLCKRWVWTGLTEASYHQGRRLKQALNDTPPNFIWKNPRNYISYCQIQYISCWNLMLYLIPIITFLWLNYQHSFFLLFLNPNSDSSFLKSVLDFFCPFSCLIFYMPRIPCRPLLCSWYMLCLTDFIHSLLPFKDSLNANDPRF